MDQLINNLSLKDSIDTNPENWANELLEDLSKENPEELDNMMSGLFSQLFSKEILYEPLKDWADKYPTWLAKQNEETGNDSQCNTKTITFSKD